MILLIILCLFKFSYSVDDISTELNLLRKEILKLTEDNNGLKNEIAQLKNKNEVLNSQMLALENKLNFGCLNLNETREPNPISTVKNVAFHANIDGSVRLADNQVIVFGDVVTNLGSGYNKATGVFVAPTSGVYVFYVSLLVYPGKTVEAELFKNGVDALEIYAAGSSSSYGPGSNLIIEELYTGDEIVVKVHEDYHDTGMLLNGPWCTFSGFLLYPN